MKFLLLIILFMLGGIVGFFLPLIMVTGSKTEPESEEKGLIAADYLEIDGHGNIILRDFSSGKGAFKPISRADVEYLMHEIVLKDVI